MVAISESDGEDALLGNILPGINNFLMTTSHNRAGITTSIQAVLIQHQQNVEADRQVKDDKLQEQLEVEIAPSKVRWEQV